MKKIILIFLLCPISFIFSQENRMSRIGLYLDVGMIISGSFGTVGIGLNVEYMLSKNFSTKTGVNYCLFGGGDFGEGNAFSIPIMINYMTAATNKFETGIGIGLVLQETRIHIFPAGSIGYRYQPQNGGVLFRAGLGLPGNSYPSLLSIGYCF
jgi:hypothetical protein